MDVIPSIMFFQLLWLKSFDSSKCLKFPNLIIENIVPESDTKDVKSFCLEKLIVYKCDRQKSILLSSVLFKVSTSLRILKISSCHKLEQFFANKNEGYASIEIAFTKLEELIMADLPWLSNFCKGTYNFNFPSLLTIHVIRCPMMKTFFTHGNLTTIGQHKWRGKKGHKYERKLNHNSTLFNEKVYDYFIFTI